MPTAGNSRLLRNGTKVKLVSLNSAEDVVFREQQLETWMQITDQPIPGELPKGM